MNHTPGEQTVQPATARAQALLGNLGRRLDLFAAQAGQRIQHAAASIGEEADRIDQPSTQPGEEAHLPTISRAEEEGKLVMERAEDLVDRLGHHLGHYLALAGFQIQRATARLCEEGEDLWAEAQNMRLQRTGSRQ
jgi:hypothetical protein